MDRTRRTLNLFGFHVGLHPSWAIIAVLIVWSLSAGLFPQYYPNLTTATYWLMGFAGALGLFASIVTHELAHSIVARRNGVHMHGITLFVFGGVAEMTDEPRTPGVELKMAIAGPLMSVALSILFYGAYRAAGAGALPVPLVGVFGYLATINLVLAAFNLVPAFPLDGGRVLHAILWRRKGDLRAATRITGALGSAFGFAMILWGTVRLLQGQLVGGVWIIILGLFLRSVARTAEQRLLVHLALERETVDRFVHPEPVTVPPEMPLAEFVERFVYRFREKMFPVVDAGRLVGLVSTEQVKKVPRAEWPARAVGDVAARAGPENTVTPDAGAEELLHRFEKEPQAKLLVAEGDHLVGTVSKRDLLDFIAIKMELEGGSTING